MGRSRLIDIKYVQIIDSSNKEYRSVVRLEQWDELITEGTTNIQGVNEQLIYIYLSGPNKNQRGNADPSRIQQLLVEGKIKFIELTPGMKVLYGI